MANLQGINKLGPNQPLESNLNALATNPKAAIDAFGIEWAGAVAASAMERLAQPEQPMKAATTATEAIKLFPEVAYWYREFLEHNTVGGIEALKSSEDQLADPYNTEVRVAIAALREQLTQPEKSPLDRMAENARELGLDYEPVQEPEYEQALMDAITGGTGVVLGGKRIDPASIYKEPEQEPVAWKDRTYGNLHHHDFGNSIPLYTTPPRREWVGLTQQDIDIAFDDTQEGGGFDDFARAIEAKLREKNNAN